MLNLTPRRLHPLYHHLRSHIRDRFLRRVSGVIHVGANNGQEADKYDALGLRVVWIEAIPEVFKELEANIAPYPRQLAIQALVTDVENGTYRFNVANNEGQSSSILDLHLHADVWPSVQYERTIELQSTTLSTIIDKYDIDLARYSALVMDTQGSELLVLKGAASILKHFSFIKTEVADFESYAGCCQVKDLDSFLSGYGFREISRHAFATHPSGGSYYNIVYRRSD